MLTRRCLIGTALAGILPATRAHAAPATPCDQPGYGLAHAHTRLIPTPA